MAIYREYASGFGSDLQYNGMIYDAAQEQMLAVVGFLTLPADHPSTGTAHSYAGVDPFPLRARDVEQGGRSCTVCHYPQPFEIPDMDTGSIPRPPYRELSQEAAGITCASCHLTPDGRIRGPYDITSAPHATVREPSIQTAAMCAFCHSEGERVVGKQTQTFLEWREDFHKAGLGSQQCQDCHMPRTTGKLAENFNVPERVRGRHLWTGGHSPQRLRSALSLAITQQRPGQPGLEFHVANVGAGHSVPTGSNRRAVYLKVAVVDGGGQAIASTEWMFAPWFGNRPDDIAFLEEDKTGPEPIAATQADAQGPHESIIRAGEQRVLLWTPELGAGDYTVDARLIHDLNRYNDPGFTGDQTEVYRASLALKID
jgi:hypothetical protein